MINTDNLIAIFPDVSVDTLDMYVNPLNQTFERADINTPLRTAAFLAQVGYESGGFRYTREIWGPTLAQKRYEGRRDLGNTEPGDGKRYLGRGLIQLTGRRNYALASDAFNTDFISEPELLEQPEWATMVAGWYWSVRGINVPADVGDFERVTKLVNGGYNGLEQRAALYEAAMKELNT